MKYHKFNDDSLFSDGIIYVEVNDGCTLRQLTVGGGEFIGSNVNHPHWGLKLAEGHFDFDAIREINEFQAASITQNEFDAVWNQHLAQHHDQWENVKSLHPIGKQVTGSILIFYPQGVITNLGANALGVADYARCQASAKPEWMYPKHKIKARVAGYDEENHWVKLVEPRVLRETIK